MGKPASGFTCDAPGPAVELHRVVERRGHRVQDTARLRVQEPHRGRERESAVGGGESEDPRGRADLEGDGRGSERQLGTPPTAVAQLRLLLLLLRAPRRQGCCGSGGDEPGEGAGTVKALRRRRSSCCELRALPRSTASSRRRCSNLLGRGHVDARGAEAPLLPPARRGSCAGMPWLGTRRRAPSVPPCPVAPPCHLSPQVPLCSFPASLSGIRP